MKSHQWEQRNQKQMEIGTWTWKAVFKEWTQVWALTWETKINILKSSTKFSSNSIPVKNNSKTSKQTF